MKHQLLFKITESYFTFVWFGLGWHLVLKYSPCSDGLFGGCSRMEGPKKSPIPKIYHKYPTKMKLGTVIPNLKKDQKIYESCNSPL